MVTLNYFAAVYHLSVRFGLDCVKNNPHVFGFVGIQFLAVEQFQSIKNGCGLLGAALAGNCPQSLLCRLGAVAAGDKDRKEGVVWCLDLKEGCQADTGDGVYQVSEDDCFIGGYTGQIPNRFAFCTFGNGPGLALVSELKSDGHVLLQPLDQFLQETVGLGFIGGLGIAR